MMKTLQYIHERLSDAKLRKDLATVVEDVDVLVPQSEAEFGEIQKFGLYPAEECVPFITKQGTPFYNLDNMSLVPKGDVRSALQYASYGAVLVIVMSVVLSVYDIHGTFLIYIRNFYTFGKNNPNNI